MAPDAPDIVCFLPALEGGGAERVVLDVASALVLERSRKVVLVVASRTGALADSVPEHLPVVDLGRGRVAKALLSLHRYLRATRPRALLSTLEHANLAAVLATRRLPGTRVVLREANTVSRDLDLSVGRDRFVLWLMRALYPRADAVVAVSEGVAEDLRNRVGVRGDKIHVIGNPVLTPRLWEGSKAPINDAWFTEGEPPVVLGIGRLARQKGFEVLIEAFAEARRRLPCRLMILGEGEERRALETQVQRLGLEADVRLPGFVGNPFPYLAQAGAFVLSSLWEGLPNVLIQAIALGTPSVATDCPSGPSEILEGGLLGHLVPVGDTERMTEAIVAALQAPRTSPSPAWLDRYSLDKVVDSYDRLLIEGKAKT